MNKRSISFLFLAATFAAFPARSFAEGEQRFASVQAAVNTLTQAVREHDTNALHNIFGPDARELVSPDPVQASNSFALFVRRVTAKVQITNPGPSQAVLEIGDDAWPFPIPICKSGETGQWYFDIAAGKDEILRRRIGADELAVIQVCHAYVSAQREYAATDHTGKQILEYAQRLRSTKGQRDGLYWHADSDEEMSPLGPLISEAHSQGYFHEHKILSEPQNPYHGYYFKILTRQGRHAPGGKYNYIINGHMIGGFALVAWPAEWGNTGIMTFIVNQQGKVMQKCLGGKTSQIASRMMSYDPDPSWQPAE